MNVRTATQEEALKLVPTLAGSAVVYVAQDGDTPCGYVAVNTDGRTMYAHEFWCGDRPYAAVMLWQRVRAEAAVHGYPFVMFDINDDYPALKRLKRLGGSGGYGTMSVPALGRG